MTPGSCLSCRRLLRSRLREQISFLASRRCGFQSLSKHCQPAADPPNLSLYWDTVAPTGSEEQAATKFFATHPPRKLWTASEWRYEQLQHRQQQQQKTGDPLASQGQLIPEVTFLGRSNVGKSSLLNTLLQAPLLNYVGPHPGKTKVMHAWGLSASDPITGGAGPGGEKDIKLAVLDMPGYAHGSRPDWGGEIVRYLRARKQLRRAFVLIDAMHGIKKTDEQMIHLLRQERISFQIVLSKVDRLVERGKYECKNEMDRLYKLIRNELVQPKRGTDAASGLDGLGEIIVVGNLGEQEKQKQKGKRNKTSGIIGIEQLRWAVLVAVGLENLATKRAGRGSTVADKMMSRIGDQTGGTPSEQIGMTRTPSPSEALRPQQRYDQSPSSETASSQKHPSEANFPSSFFAKYQHDPPRPFADLLTKSPTSNALFDLSLSSSSSTTTTRSSTPLPPETRARPKAEAEAGTSTGVGVGGMADLLASSSVAAARAGSWKRGLAGQQDDDGKGKAKSRSRNRGKRAGKW